VLAGNPAKKLPVKECSGGSETNQSPGRPGGKNKKRPCPGKEKGAATKRTRLSKVFPSQVSPHKTSSRDRRRLEGKDLLFITRKEVVMHVPRGVKSCIRKALASSGKYPEGGLGEFRLVVQSLVPKRMKRSPKSGRRRVQVRRQLEGESRGKARKI